MKSSRFISVLSLLISLAGGLALDGCTRKASDPELALGHPVIDALRTRDAGRPTQVEVSARPPGIAPWSARMTKDVDGHWRFAARSGTPAEVRDLADTKLVDHFISVVESFTTESEAAKGNDANFGLAPYRMEIRLGPSTPALRIGDPVGANGVYFRIGEGRPWIGRGALIELLATLENPDSLVYKSPYRAPVEEIQAVRLAKVQGKDRGTWEFQREGTQWHSGKTPLSEEKSALIDRIFHQRIAQILPVKDLPDLKNPDWILTVQTAREKESLTLLFSLNNVFGKNPDRTDRALELYPELAGALRAFTQARLTPRKSGTK